MSMMSIESTRQNSIFLLVFVFLICSVVVVTSPMYFAQNNGDQTEHSKTSGKNGKHANVKARNVAKEKYDQVKRDYDELLKKPNKTKADKRQLEKLSKQLKHWKKKKDFKGENHSQKPKGN